MVSTYVKGPGLLSESAFTRNPPKSGMKWYISVAASRHHFATDLSKGSAVDRFPNSIGLAKSTDKKIVMPYFLKISANRAISGR